MKKCRKKVKEHKNKFTMVKLNQAMVKTYKEQVPNEGLRIMI